MIKHCTTATKNSNKEKSKDKNGFEKKEERALFKNIISAGEEKKHPKKRPDLGEGGKSVRT
jgi:hypothetical protein